MSGFGSEDSRVPAYFDGQDRARGSKGNTGEDNRTPSFYDGQDWTLVTIKKKPTKPKAEPVEKSHVNQRNNHLSLSGKNLQGAQARKLAESTDIKKPRTLSLETQKEISATRNSLGLTQTELNKKCQFPMNTIRDIESGKINPTPQQMDALSRELKIPIRYSRN
jgi:ribosome-binding protein aMBF1 (putative translation factor)